MAKKGSSLTRFLEDVVDSTKKVVDAQVDTAKDVDKSLRTTARKAAKKS